jgi:23S rRNA pseudouridine1911/1915/1917 synthase
VVPEAGPFPGISTMPAVIAETEDYAVAYKPPRMHSAPLVKASADAGTLFEWYAKIFPAVMNVAGKKALDGGLLHRLDFETHGLLLLAKNQSAMDHVNSLQEHDLFIKEYGALVRGKADIPPFVESYFRPFGRGRKEVRPVIDPQKNRKETAADRGKPYRTEILSADGLDGDRMYLRLRLRRGFRHQIRCHLDWIGMPILNDPVYGQYTDELDAGGVSFLALRCEGLYFTDPRSGEDRVYRLPPLCTVSDFGGQIK